MGQRARASRAALSRAKSSPAWCEERVSGERRDHQKSFGIGDGLVSLELVGRHEPDDLMVLAGRLQILADGEEVDVGGAQVVHHLQNLVSLLAETDHDPRLGEHRGIDLLHLLQQPDRGEIARARPHREIFRRHGLEIVVEHVGPRRRHGVDRAAACAKNRA